MKVSVIIPVYNTAEYLEKCISSILVQTYKNFELIIINDGSTDKSSEIIKKIMTIDSRIIYRHFENSGVSTSRNRGLDLASGDYVIFIDSDDWVDPDFIQDFIINMSSNPKRLVVQDLKEVFPQQTMHNVQGYNNELLNIPQDFSYFISNYRFTQGYACNKFYNLSLIRENRIRFVDNVMNEDELFYMDYIKHVDEIFFSKKDNYNYLQRNNSLTGKLWSFTEAKIYLEGLILFLQYLTSIKKDSPEIKVYVENRINHIFDYVLRSCIYGHNYTWKARIKYINELYSIILPFIHVLRPKTQLQKIDLKLFMKKEFLILNFVITFKTKLN